METGKVTKALGQHYYVLYQNEVIPCFVRANLKKKNRHLVSPVAVGDLVKFSLKDKVIEGIFPRKTKFSRKASGSWGNHKEQIIASNIDQIVVFFAADTPKPNNKLIDRFLVLGEANELDIILCFNKWDLNNSDTESLISLYSKIGYQVLTTSVVNNSGLDKFKDVLHNKTSVLLGPSGVGKSTIINTIQPELFLRKGEVSQKTGKGKHTTTFAEMFPLTFGGNIIDTPGVREMGLFEISSIELSWLFLEMREPLEYCRFRDCIHKDEPDCSVKKAIEDGKIDIRRYESYLSML